MTTLKCGFMRRLTFVELLRLAGMFFSYFLFIILAKFLSVGGLGAFDYPKNTTTLLLLILILVTTHLGISIFRLAIYSSHEFEKLEKVWFD